MKYGIIIPVLLASVITCSGQPQNYYKKVDQVLWIVEDLDAVESGWKKLGFEGILRDDPVIIPNQEYKGKKVSIEITTAYASLGGLMVTWIQPGKGNNAFSDFLKKNGDGGMALLHRVSDPSDIDKETSRLSLKGVKVLQKGSIDSEAGTITYTLFDTQKSGKYVLGLIHGPEMPYERLTNSNVLNLQFSQYAFAIEDPAEVSAYWEKLGFPKMEITHTRVTDREYYGKYSDFDMNLGWQRHGNIVYEWCIPIRPPTVYADHIRKSGEGIQHFGFNVSDMDSAIAFMKEQGYVISMSGGWGEKDQEGSGRFAYVDIENSGGETIELLWSFTE